LNSTRVKTDQNIDKNKISSPTNIIKNKKIFKFGSTQTKKVINLFDQKLENLNAAIEKRSNIQLGSELKFKPEINKVNINWDWDSF